MCMLTELKEVWGLGGFFGKGKNQQIFLISEKSFTPPFLEQRNTANVKYWNCIYLAKFIEAEQGFGRVISSRKDVYMYFEYFSKKWL